jgi:hypothetical protein
MPKGRLCNRGESGSEKRAKLQRHIVNEPICRLSTRVLAISDRYQKTVPVPIRDQ